MHVFSRDFTLREKILLLVLALILLGFFYYFVVDEPVRTSLNTAKAESEDLSIEVTTLQAQLTHVQKMSEELEETVNSPQMLSYNGIKSEVAFLNDVMEDAATYNMSFSDVTRAGDQIRRNVALTFTASDYKTAETILRTLADCPYRCLIGTVNVNSASRDKTDDIGKGEVSVSLDMTFYETMVDGTPDAGLPEDTSETSTGETDVIDDYLDDYYSN